MIHHFLEEQGGGSDLIYRMLENFVAHTIGYVEELTPCMKFAGMFLEFKPDFELPPASRGMSPEEIEGRYSDLLRLQVHSRSNLEFITQLVNN